MAERGEDLKEAGGLWPPASFKTLPLLRIDYVLLSLTLAGPKVLAEGPRSEGDSEAKRGRGKGWGRWATAHAATPWEFNPP
jgi:hypothetical protein